MMNATFFKSLCLALFLTIPSVGKSATVSFKLSSDHIITEVLTMLTSSQNGQTVAIIASISTPEDELKENGEYYQVVDEGGTSWFVEKVVFELYFPSGWYQQSEQGTQSTSQNTTVAMAA